MGTQPSSSTQVAGRGEQAQDQGAIMQICASLHCCFKAVYVMVNLFIRLSQRVCKEVNR